ncbi:PREDICTED: involucrin [Atta colombica]|uniref:involucrin n=1 Tax=Atta colombica TaxID=520822 RepID=UPI00084C6E63|nr:PREDICTED: involucrin [Atta colombica]
MPEASGSGMTDEDDYSTFENKTGLAEDMKFLASMPELCDVTFLVGDTREPVCAVKAVLAARSRVFHKMLYQTPSPQRKKEPPARENKIRLFLKRSSEPLLNLQNAAQQRSGFTQQLAPIQEPQSHQHHTLIIEEFEPDVFRQLIEYIHTGCVTLQPRTLLGVMNAADYYGLDELRRACAGFVQCCITVDTVCALLASAERYIQYKCTKSLVQKVLEFVDEHGNEVLNLGSFTLLPQHVVRLILAREELRADEFTKFQAALMWSKKYCDNNQNTPLKDVIGNFIEYIQFHKIPATVLMQEVNPLGLVPPEIIMNALAYQADPTSVDPRKFSPHRVRRQGRSMSVQSSLDPYGSITTLSSSGSDAGSDQKQNALIAAVSDEPRRTEDICGPDEGAAPTDDIIAEEREQKEKQRPQQQQSQRQQQDQQQESQVQVHAEQEAPQSQEQQKQEQVQSQQKEPGHLQQQVRQKIEKDREQRKLQQEQQLLQRKLELEEQLRRKLERDEEVLQRKLEEEEKPLQQKMEHETRRKLEKEEQQQIMRLKKETEQLKKEEIKRSPKAERVLQQKKVDDKQPQLPKADEQPELQQKRKQLQEPLDKNERAKLRKQGEKVEISRQESLVQQQKMEITMQEDQEAQRKEKPQLPQPGESQQQQQLQPQQQQPQLHQEQSGIRPLEGVSGLYIRIVLRHEGRANLVWLYKTHIF